MMHKIGLQTAYIFHEIDDKIHKQNWSKFN